METENVQQPQTVQNSEDPMKNLEQKKFVLKLLVFITLILAVIGILLLGYFLYKNSATTDRVKQEPTSKLSDQSVGTISPAPTENPSTNSTSGKIAPKNTILYAKEVSESDENGRGWPTYTIFASDVQGKEKIPLFTVGSVNNYPIDFRFLKQKNAILINLEHSLFLYDLQTGKMPDVYIGKSGEGYILGGALSHDGKYLLFNYSTNYVNSTGPENKIVLVNLDDKSQKEIFSGKPGYKFRGYLVPEFWSPEDTRIYLGGTVASDGPFGYSAINKDGSTLHLIPDMNTSGINSDDGSFYVYTLASTDNSIKRTCYSSPPNPILKLFTSSTEQQVTVEQNILNDYSVRGWSPDNKKFVYDVKKYKSGEGCDATFYPVESFMYDITLKTSSKVSSYDQQLVEWGVTPVNIAVNGDISGKIKLTAGNSEIDTISSTSSNDLLYLGYYK